MNRWVKLAMLFVAAFVASQFLLQSPMPRMPAGKGAPALALQALDGRRHDLAGLRGKNVLVNFWATWCGPCLIELPELAALSRDRCVEVLGVVEDSPDDDVQERSREIPYPVLLDPGGAAGSAWGVQGFPTSFLVDGEGRVRRVFTGPVSRRGIREALPPAAAASCPAG
jgi:thiol-disulfide isomerase/thioredoxin